MTLLFPLPRIASEAIVLTLAANPIKLGDLLPFQEAPFYGLPRESVNQ